MNTKKLFVSFCAIAFVLFLVGTLAATSSVTSNASIEVDGVNVLQNPAVVAGDTVVVEVTFTANVNASDMRVRAEIEGDKVDVEAVSTPFDVEANHTYKKALKIQVPSELSDQLSNDINLGVKIWNGDFKSEFPDNTLRVQRPSYDAVVKSVSVSQSVTAGQTFPVDLVLKNMGYNELKDLYVTASIPALGIEKTSYFGDLVPIKECNDDCNSEDTVSGRLYLDMPYEAEAGVYPLEITVTNSDTTTKVVKQLTVKNDFGSNVIVTTTSKTVKVGQAAEYTLLLVNPTNSLKVYSIVPESSGALTSSADSAVVAVPAGSSKTVTVSASADQEGEYNFNVNVLSGSNVESTVKLSLKAEKSTTSSPLVVLTVVLAIIFLVLLVVLIVLLGRKPKKAEEFGESYY